HHHHARDSRPDHRQQVDDRHEDTAQHRVGHSRDRQENVSATICSVATYGLPREMRVLSMAAVMAEKAARRASSSDVYARSGSPASETLRPESSNSALDVQAPEISCLVVTMIRRP